MFLELLQAAGTAATIYQHRKSISQFLRRLRRKVQNGVWEIPIFGDAGCGKSVLGKFLIGELDTAVAAAGGYRESFEIETRTINQEYPYSFVIGPGQKRRRAATWNQLFRVLESTKRPTVILNVASYGHGSFIGDRSDHAAYRKSHSQQQFRDKYLRFNQEQELVALRELAERIKTTSNRVTMLSVVTKQDLWWNDRQVVKEHYEQGEYAEIIKQITQVRGEAGFEHKLWSISLIQLNLLLDDQFCVAQTAAGYDERLQMRNLDEFAYILGSILHLEVPRIAAA